MRRRFSITFRSTRPDNGQSRLSADVRGHLPPLRTGDGSEVSFAPHVVRARLAAASTAALPVLFAMASRCGGQRVEDALGWPAEPDSLRADDDRAGSSGSGVPRWRRGAAHPSGLLRPARDRHGGCLSPAGLPGRGLRIIARVLPEVPQTGLCQMMTSLRCLNPRRRRAPAPAATPCFAAKPDGSGKGTSGSTACARSGASSAARGSRSRDAWSPA